MKMLHGGRLDDRILLKLILQKIGIENKDWI
jgi:hypothetical protein